MKARFLHCGNTIRDTQLNTDKVFKNCRESRKAARLLRIEHGETSVKLMPKLDERPLYVPRPPSLPPASKPVAIKRHRHIPARKAKRLATS